MKSTILVVLFSVVFVHPLLGGQKSAEVLLTKADFIMSPEEALNFSAKTVIPFITACVKDESAPVGLRERVKNLVSKIKANEISYAPLPTYYPDRTMKIVAKNQTLNGEKFILLFVPEALDLQKTLSEEDFKYFLLVSMGHEMIHDEKPTDDEATVWGETITQIIRPLLAQGKMSVPYFKDLSARFEQAKDDRRNKEWVKLWTAKPTSKK